MLGYGPAVAFVTIKYHARLGFTLTLASALVTGAAVLGYMALFVSYFQSAIERLGFKRFGSWLRRWWDEAAL